MRGLAARFRRKAGETRLADFVELMLRTARELEEMAAELERGASPEARRHCRSPRASVLDVAQGPGPQNADDDAIRNYRSGEWVGGDRVSASAGEGVS
jgi:hypothetical protein